MIAPGGPIVCVRESHRGAEVVNELVAVPGDGSAPRVLASGRDFYSNPRPSPDGRLLAWLEWDHPSMPWDGTELRVAELGPAGELGVPRLVAGGTAESIWQPEWSPGGRLHYVSDRSGWWNLYDETGERVVVDEAEYGYPHWVFGGSTYAFTADGGVDLHPRVGRPRAALPGRRRARRAARPPLYRVRLSLPAGPRRDRGLHRGEPRDGTRGDRARPRIRRHPGAAPSERARAGAGLRGDPPGDRVPDRAAARPLTASSTRPRTPSSKRPRESGRR